MKHCPYCKAEIESVDMPKACPSCHSVFSKQETPIPDEAVTVQQAELIHWDTRFALGIAKIDEQHERLCHLINELFRAVRFNVYGPNFIPRALLQLREYAVFHFQEEEALFRDVAYPSKPDHLKRHHDFIMWVEKLEGSYKEAFLDIKPILKHLVEWFVEHTQKVDREYVPYVRKGK